MLSLATVRLTICSLTIARAALRSLTSRRAALCSIATAGMALGERGGYGFLLPDYWKGSFTFSD